jgi:hypothetical protein
MRCNMKSAVVSLILFGTGVSQNCLAGGYVPTILVQPLAINVSLLGTALFTVVALGDGSTVTYQWMQNGVPVPGATSGTFTISNVQMANQGAYSVLISDGGGSTLSSTVPLSIPNVAPSISAEPQSETVANGTSSTNNTFSVTASGTYPMTYQWTFSGSKLTGDTR